MNNKVNVMVYNGDKVTYEIPNFNNLRGIFVKVISGDHVVTPIYEDGRIGDTLDPNRHDRVVDFYDGSAFVETADLDDYNNMVNVYDVIRKYSCNVFSNNTLNKLSQENR